MLKATLEKLKKRGPTPVGPEHPGAQDGMDSLFLAAGDEFSSSKSGDDSQEEEEKEGLARTPFPVAGSYLKPKLGK